MVLKIHKIIIVQNQSGHIVRIKINKNLKTKYLFTEVSYCEILSKTYIL